MDRSTLRLQNVRKAKGKLKIVLYNGEHRHSGIGLLTPEMVRYGKAEDCIEQRRNILCSAFEANPEQLVRVR
jgi:hypothetical protein